MLRYCGLCKTGVASPDKVGSEPSWTKKDEANWFDGERDLYMSKHSRNGLFTFWTVNVASLKTCLITYKSN